MKSALMGKCGGLCDMSWHCWEVLGPAGTGEVALLDHLLQLSLACVALIEVAEQMFAEVPGMLRSP